MMKPGHGFGDQSMKSGRFGKWARALGDQSGGGGRGCLVRARCSTDQPNHSLGLGLLLGLGPLRGCSLRWCLKIVCLMNAARFLPLGRPGPLMETDGLAEPVFPGRFGQVRAIRSRSGHIIRFKTLFPKSSIAQ